MNYDTLVVPESLSCLEPQDLVRNILRSVRLMTGRANAISTMTLENTPTRSGYQTWDILLSDIVTVKVGDPAVVKYRVPAKNSSIDALGVALDNKLGLRGVDFYYEDGYYIFNEHPTTFGTVSVTGGRNILTLSVIGSPLQTMLEPLGVAYHHTANLPARSAIRDALYRNSPLGVSHTLIEAVGGCRFSVDPLVDAWEEGDYTMGVTTRGELVYAPKNLEIPFMPGSPIDVSNVLLFNKTAAWLHSDVFYVKLSSGSTLIFSGDNDIADYPAVAKDYPTVKITDGKFSGIELIIEMLKNGCVFYRWQYIKDNSDAQKALSNYAVNPGKVVIETVVEREASLGLPSYDSIDWTSYDPANMTSTASAYNYI